jgi:hypothetical protein
VNYLPGLASNQDPLDLSLKGSRIPGVSHCLAGILLDSSRCEIELIFTNRNWANELDICNPSYLGGRD